MLQLAAWLEGRRSEVRSGGERLSAPAAAVAVLPVTSTARPAGVGTTPFARFRARLSRLAPASTSIDDYHTWLQSNALGSDPDGYWYDDMVALLERHPLPEPELEPTSAAEPEPVPTLAQAVAPRAEPRLDLVLVDDEDDDPVPPVAACVSSSLPLPSLTRLEPDVAAERFVEWVRLADRCGTYTNREFTELTEEFYAAEDLEPLTDNVLRPALEALSGAVIKSRSNHQQGRGRRQRHWKWTILEAETMETPPPWEELREPQRRAA